MALRLVEIRLPAERAKAMQELLDELSLVARVDEVIIGDRMLVRLLLDGERRGPLVDAVSDRFGASGRYQILMLPVEAVVPRPPELEPPPEEPDVQTDADDEPTPTGVNREELYAKTLDMTKISRTFVATVLLSTVVAAVGIRRNNVAVIIGAMVIAPLLGPNVALALATTLGDFKLMKTAFRANSLGLLIVLLATIVLGFVLPIDPTGAEIASRTEVYLSDIVLALAAGSAGVFALTTGVPAALVGVMVAVALLPPTVVVGLMLGSGHWDLAGQATLLLLTNIICVNLAGVLTFLVQGVQPRSWWEVDRAKRSTRFVLTIWVALLIALAALIVITRSGQLVP